MHISLYLCLCVFAWMYLWSPCVCVCTHVYIYTLYLCLCLYKAVSFHYYSTSHLPPQGSFQPLCICIRSRLPLSSEYFRTCSITPGVICALAAAAKSWGPSPGPPETGASLPPRRENLSSEFRMQAFWVHPAHSCHRGDCRGTA